MILSTVRRHDSTSKTPQLLAPSSALDAMPQRHILSISRSSRPARPLLVPPPQLIHERLISLQRSAPTSAFTAGRTHMYCPQHIPNKLFPPYIAHRAAASDRLV